MVWSDKDGSSIEGRAAGAADNVDGLYLLNDGLRGGATLTVFKTEASYRIRISTLGESPEGKRRMKRYSRAGFEMLGQGGNLKTSSAQTRGCQPHLTWGIYVG